MWQEQVIESDVWEHNGQEYKVKIVVDEYPDLSFLGEYTDKVVVWDDRYLIIDRKANRDINRNEYRYFVSTRDLEHERQWLSDHGYSKHESWLLSRQYARRDYARYESFNRGDWCMVGVVVTKESDNCPTCGQTIEHVESLWGIESDYTEEYLTEIVEELIEQIENGS